MKVIPRAFAVLVPLVLLSPGLTGVAYAQSSARGPAPAADNEVMASLQERVLSLEETIQQLTGQIEELKFKNTQMARQMQQLQDDLSLRVATLEQAAGRAPKVGSPAPPTQGDVPTRSMTSPANGLMANPEPGPTSETFDPNAPISRPVQKQPDMTAPIVPTTTPSAATTPAPTTDGMVLRTDANGHPLAADPGAAVAPSAPTAPPPAPVPRAAPNPPQVATSGVGSGSPPVTVDLPNGTPKQQYDFAFDCLKRQDYARAEASFRQFLKLHPKDPLAGNAQFWLGESLYVRGDFQQAAVEFMNGYENYPKSNKGPDNLLELGRSMAKLNQSQGACTAFGRVAQEYPDASDDIRKNVQTERAKLKCS